MKKELEFGCHSCHHKTKGGLRLFTFTTSHWKASNDITMSDDYSPPSVRVTANCPECGKVITEHYSLATIFEMAMDDGE